MHRSPIREMGRQEMQTEEFIRSTLGSQQLFSAARDAIASLWTGTEAVDSEIQRRQATIPF